MIIPLYCCTITALTGFTIAPPPQETIPVRCDSVRIIFDSSLRNASSPFCSKISGIVIPVCRTISASISISGICSCSASTRPSAVLPHPIKPHRNSVILSPPLLEINAVFLPPFPQSMFVSVHWNRCPYSRFHVP